MEPAEIKDYRQLLGMGARTDPTFRKAMFMGKGKTGAN